MIRRWQYDRARDVALYKEPDRSSYCVTDGRRYVRIIFSHRVSNLDERSFVPIHRELLEMHPVNLVRLELLESGDVGYSARDAFRLARLTRPHRRAR